MPEKSPYSCIINGKHANISDYPFYVYIDTDRCYCGGALLSRNVVLTAAHCVSKSSISKIKVIPGLRKRKQSKRTVYRPKEVIIHPKYCIDDCYDIALLILNSNVKPCGCIDIIDISSCKPCVGDVVTVVGYGYTKLLRDKYGCCLPTPSKYLRSSRRKIMCFEGPIMNTYSNNSRTCLGDSGSPVIYNGELVGIHVSGEYYCGRTSYHITLAHPKIYSFLVDNLPFLDQ
ncbi:snake venom serine protease pallase-like [Onthophagus taurus]|uniref:snake venom serine protease pallase-like n=1 Tax=Onthophagus taurus TaxID=166361 RepID=UPI000C1FDE87|nr:snake venom serine protease pallase-like [Onthophagus taurus]